MSATTLHPGTMADARAIAQSAAQVSEIATRRSSRSSRAAKNPPVAVPAALPSRYAVRAEVANASETP